MAETINSLKEMRTSRSIAAVLLIAGRWRLRMDHENDDDEESTFHAKNTLKATSDGDDKGDNSYRDLE